MRLRKLTFLFLFTLFPNIVLMNDFRSIHQEQLIENYDKKPIPFKNSPAYFFSKRGTAYLTKEVMGFYPYWSGANYPLRWDLLSILAWFEVAANGDGSLSIDHGLPDPELIQTAHENGVKVVIVIINFNSDNIVSILSNPNNRARLINESIELVQDLGIDGVNIDFEGVPGSQKQNLVTFMTELTDSFHQINPDYHISICTPAVDWRNAFDYDQLAIHSSALMIMAYNYHWSGSSIAGPVSPLRGWGTYNVEWTIQDYLNYGGEENRHKFILGLPFYGIEWPTESGEKKSPTTGKGKAKTYVQAKALAEQYGRLWDDEGWGPWVSYDTYRQCWYDDGESLGYKYDLVLEYDLGGIGIWALGYQGPWDDLWIPIEEHFATNFTPTPTPTLTPIETSTPIPTFTPTITPTPEAEIYIHFNKDDCYQKGDNFILSLEIINNTSHSLETNLFVVLDLGENFTPAYYFYPSWSPDIDYVSLHLSPKVHYPNYEILNFNVPEGVPSISISFWAGLTNEDLSYFYFIDHQFTCFH